MRYLLVLFILLLTTSAMADIYGDTNMIYGGLGVNGAGIDFCANQVSLRIIIGATDQLPESIAVCADYYYVTTSVQMCIYHITGSDTTVFDTTAPQSYGSSDDRQWNWFDLELDSTLTANDTFLIAVAGDGDALMRRNDLAGKTICVEGGKVDYSSWEDPWSGGSVTDGQTFSLILHTSDAGGEPPAESVVSYWGMDPTGPGNVGADPEQGGNIATTGE